MGKQLSFTTIANYGEKESTPRYLDFSADELEVDSSVRHGLGFQFHLSPHRKTCKRSRASESSKTQDLLCQELEYVAKTPVASYRRLELLQPTVNVAREFPRIRLDTAAKGGWSSMIFCMFLPLDSIV